jgi:3D (Asp-Asp-Asp) domain-containing protein
VSPGFGRALSFAACLGLSPWVAGAALQARGASQAEPAVRYRIESVESLPEARVSKIPRLPKGRILVLDTGRLQRWRCLVELRTGQAPKELKRIQCLRKGLPPWVLQGLGPDLEVRFPEFGLARPAVKLEATGYDPGPVDNTRGWVGVTKSGERARFGIAAVDPKLIPLGSYLYVEGYGPALAADVGGAIKGSRIDLCFNSTRQANAWGRKKARVWRIDPLYGRARERWQARLAPSSRPLG